MEKQFIDWLINNYSGHRPPVVLGIGDDAGVVQSDKPLAIATDMIADGIHFDGRQHSVRQIGHKSLAVSLSDIAAMGAKPVAATLNIFCPSSWDLDQLKQLFIGIQATAKKFDTQIFGGDTNRWDGKLVIGTTVLGSPYPQAKTAFWRMNTAQPGDWILVTGTLGGSITSKHIEFEPRIDLARRVIEKFQVSAATDITDSLSIDLASVASQSNCGFQLEESQIPVSDAAVELSNSSGRSAVEHALYDGEDFELLLFASAEESNRILGDKTFNSRITKIGEMNASKQFSINECAGSTGRELQIKGFVH